MGPAIPDLPPLARRGADLAGTARPMATRVDDLSRAGTGGKTMAPRRVRLRRAAHDGWICRWFPLAHSAPRDADLGDRHRCGALALSRPGTIQSMAGLYAGNGDRGA